MSSRRGRFVERNSDAVGPEDAQVAVSLQSPAQEFSAAAFPQIHPDRVEEILVGEAVTELLEALGQAAGEVMHTTGNSPQSFRSMIDRIHRGHDREKHLRRADVARRFVAADVLLARLQREPVSGASGGIMGNADQSSRQMAFVLIARREISRMRSAAA